MSTGRASRDGAGAGAPVRRVIIHGHFYQPPREDPWLEEMPEQPGAAPWHDWNEKIERECYRAVVAARVLDGDGRIARVVNALEYTSFDVGPTLFEWMERAAPATYAAIIDADRRSVQRLGHGNALAQPYHHVILPLASRRDKVTEVRWGIADFVRRFGRAPEGMWLPETAVDDETLDVLAQEGIKFTVLAPSQVVKPPARGMMGAYHTTHGRTIAIGVYDGDLSHGVAFGRLLVNARVWRAEVLNGLDEQAEPSVVSIATDGETYGHHHHFTEMALAWLLDDLDHTPRVEVTNYAALLAAMPPQETVELVSPSSWSCAHGVERWRSNCGCRIAADVPPRQEWRAPLREGLDVLRTRLDDRFAVEGVALFRDPWGALDAYGAVVAGDIAARHEFIESQVHRDLTDAQKMRARELLEMLRDGLRMFTSCAWFFDRLDGLEVAQNLRYAARAIDLAGSGGDAMERELFANLGGTRPSGSGELTAADVWARDARPVVPPVVRLAAGVGAASHLVPGWAPSPTPAYDTEARDGTVHLRHRRSGRDHRFRVGVTARGIASAYAYVHAPADEPISAHDDVESPRAHTVATIPVSVHEFPEREREAVLGAVRAARRRVLARRLLSPETRRRIAQGDVTLVDAAVHDLTDTIVAIADEPLGVHARRALKLVDLIELLGREIPFDAQTAYARTMHRVALEHRPIFAALGTRLGFATDFLATLQPERAGERP